MVRVIVLAAAQDDLNRLPSVILLRIDKILLELHKWPQVSGVKALRGSLKGWYRKRTGDYRILFRVAGDRLYVERVGIRRDVYEE